MSDLRAAIREHAKEAAATTPGRLEVEVEAGKDRVPGADRFRELLEHALRIAAIDAEANLPAATGA